MPRSCPTASATWRASPVIIATSTPDLAEFGDGLPGFGADLVLERQRADDRVVADEVQDRGATLLPCTDGVVERQPGTSSCARRSSAGPPTAYVTPSMSASTPRPVIDRNPVAVACRRCSRAAVDDRSGQRVFAVGLDGGREAQHLVVGRTASVPATPVTTWAPLVSVPVLSNSTVSIERIRSRASRSFTRMPALRRNRCRQAR